MTEAVAPVRVRFGEHEVVIWADAPQLAEALRHSFRHMLGSGGGVPLAEVDLRRVGRGFEGRGPTGTLRGESSEEAALRWARYQAIEQFIQARRDLVWLHGAAAGWRGRALLLPGPRGRGKSTLVTELCLRGWSFFTDDIVPIVPDSLEVVPFPQAPAVRSDPGRELPERLLVHVPKTEIRLDDRVARHPVTVGAIILPVARREGQATLEPVSPGATVLELAQGCWNFAAHGERAVDVLTRLVAGRPTLRLVFRDARPAAQMVRDWAEATWGGGDGVR